ncbi:MAG: hypothetical protein HC908_07785 [Calothrix sp. SM1_7_51]|nr:hypothetical protein [Calothrix sp. SM1_7_51]
MSYQDSAEPLARGLEYLRMVRCFALEPGMVDAMELASDRIQICTWIGENIHKVNAQLNNYLQSCHECFHIRERRHIRIFAAPLAQRLGIDGICNILSYPITILVDVGRVAPPNWLGLVAHEYAHAHLRESGHNQKFANVVSHLSLGLGLEPPSWDVGKMETCLRNWPHCESTREPLAFWKGVKFREFLL